MLSRLVSQSKCLKEYSFEGAKSSFCETLKCVEISRSKILKTLQPFDGYLHLPIFIFERVRNCTCQPIKVVVNTTLTVNQNQCLLTQLGKFCDINLFTLPPMDSTMCYSRDRSSSISGEGPEEISIFY